MKIIFFLLIYLFINMAALQARELEFAGTVKGEDNVLHRRIDFGNAYISGQSLKSGALYMLQRKSSEIKSMFEYRQNYREEILKNFSIIKKEEISFE